MKKWLWIVIGVLVVLFTLLFLKDVIVKVSVERAVEYVTGLKLRIHSFHVGILNPVVRIRGLVLYNPRQFPEKVMAEMPEIYIDYDLPAILRNDIHLREIRIALKEFVVVKDRNGELNLNSLKVVQAQKKGSGPAKEAAVPKIRIDDLRLKIGKAVYKDYSAGAAPSVKEFNINIDEQYTNITDPYTLVSLIVVKALANTSISSMSNFDLNGLQGTVSDTLSKAKAVATHAQSIAKETEGVLKNTGKGLSDIFKSPLTGGK